MLGTDHRKLERKSQDTIAVYNPTGSLFVVLWNSFQNVIPARTKNIGHGPGAAHLPRYILVIRHPGWIVMTEVGTPPGPAASLQGQTNGLS